MSFSFCLGADRKLCIGVRSPPVGCKRDPRISRFWCRCVALPSILANIETSKSTQNTRHVTFHGPRGVKGGGLGAGNGRHRELFAAMVPEAKRPGAEHRRSGRTNGRNRSPHVAEQLCWGCHLRPETMELQQSFFGVPCPRTGTRESLAAQAQAWFLAG